MFRALRIDYAMKGLTFLETGKFENFKEIFLNNV